MGHEWKPGDVAVVACDDPDCESATHPAVYSSVDKWWVLDDGTYSSRVRPIRPLVVVDLSETPAASDPAQRSEAHHLIDMLRETAEHFFVPDAAALARKVADQIETQVGPRKPPKPDEPTGLGAVVEDTNGDRWVRTFPDGGPAKWRVASLDLDREPWAAWSAISAVRVLSEGVDDQ